MSKFEDLREFVNRAEKNRKYPSATADTLRASLKLYEPELNDEEKNSIDNFKKNLEQITSIVFKKNANRFTASSLATYKSRLQKVLSDFDKYNDPIKMNGWTPKVIARTKRRPINTDSSQQNGHDETEVKEEGLGESSNMHRIELSLRDG